MSRQLKFIAVFIAFLLFGTLGVYYKNYQDEIQTENIKRFLDFQIQILNKNLQSQEVSALSLAILLSQNENIKNCLLQNDKELCRDILVGFSHTLKDVPIFQNVRFHLHTPELKSFVRSWTGLKDDSLAGFRFMLQEAKKSDIAGIEVGRAGALIRGVSQIFDGNTLLGSIEILLDFEHLSKFFGDFGVDLFVMVDENVADVHLKDNQNNLVGKFYVANKQFANLNVLPFLQDGEFVQSQFLKFDNHNFAIQKMHDTRGMKIGYFVLYFNQDKAERNLLKLTTWF